MQPSCANYRTITQHDEGVTFEKPVSLVFAATVIRPCRQSNKARYIGSKGQPRHACQKLRVHPGSFDNRLVGGSVWITKAACIYHKHASALGQPTTIYFIKTRSSLVTRDICTYDRSRTEQSFSCSVDTYMAFPTVLIDGYIRGCGKHNLETWWPSDVCTCMWQKLAYVKKVTGKAEAVCVQSIVNAVAFGRCILERHWGLYIIFDMKRGLSLKGKYGTWTWWHTHW